VENWYFRSGTGAACGPGTRRPLESTAGASAATEDITTEHTWNRVETATRTIGTGDWSVSIDVTTGAGTGPQNRVTAVVERRDSSCVVQETLLNVQSGNLTADSTQEVTLTATGVPQVDFAADDILTVRVVRSQGSRSQVVRFNDAADTDADSRLTTPDEVAGGGSALVTPGLGLVAIAAFAAIVSVTNHQTVQPGVGAVAIESFAPTVTVTDHQTVTPGVGAVAITGFAPTVTAGSGAGIFDDFNDDSLDTSLWTATSGTVAETGGQLEITDTGAGIGACDTDLDYSVAIDTPLAGQWWMLKVVQLPSATDGHFARLRLARTGGEAEIIASISRVSGAWKFELLFRPSGGPPVTQNSVSHNGDEWLAVRRNPSTGDVEMGSSPDGRLSTINIHYTDANWGATLETGWRASISAGVGGVGSSATAIFDDFNVATAEAGGVTVEPGLGAVAIAGLAPTVTASDHQTATPGLGAVVIDGFAPTIAISDHQTVEPGSGAVAVDGFAPVVTVSDHQTVLPGTGEVAINGFAPTVAVTGHQVVQPGLGVIAIAGHAPTVQTTADVTVEPGTGAVPVEGFAPTLAITDHQVVQPGTGQAVIVGAAPVVSATDHQLVTPGLGEVVIAGFAPVVSISADVTVQPGTGAVSVNGFAPAVTVSEHQTVEPGTGEVAIAGFAPDVTASDHQTVEPGAGDVAIDSFAPTVRLDVFARPGPGSIAVEGFAPAVTGGGSVVVIPGLGVVTIAGFAPLAFSVPPRPSEKDIVRAIATPRIIRAVATPREVRALALPREV